MDYASFYWAARSRFLESGRENHVRTRVLISGESHTTTAGVAFKTPSEFCRV